MKQKHVDILIHQYLENELSNDDSLSFEQHIVSCEKCRQLVEFSKKAYEYLEYEVQQELPVFREKRIIETLIEQNKRIPKNSQLYLIQKIAVAAAIVIGLMLGVLIGSSISINGANTNHSFSSEFYISDISYEPVESYLLNE